MEKVVFKQPSKVYLYLKKETIMPIQRYRTKYEILPEGRLAAWRNIPPAIVGDCMNRSNVMSAGIKPVKEGSVLVGQARTVQVMVGDNSALHVATKLVNPGEILVVDAGGFLDTAVWGGIMTRAAISRSIAGLVVDGTIRDIAEIRELGFVCYARGANPTGPHKGFGGIIDGMISCGGCPVNPGDLIIGDDDGIAVVPLSREAELLEASKEKLIQEEQTNAKTARGVLPADQMGLDEPDWIG
jgi:4-hydroxy-4-methyl-2-oxoglutarate aldolase